MIDISINNTSKFSKIAARSRKCCPQCGAISIRIHTRQKGYTCYICKHRFFITGEKQVKAHLGKIPHYLKGAKA
ncbi:MAG: zinc finger protein [Methanosarcina spindle-shaped virus 1]